MTSPTDWARAYARQADADLRAWETSGLNPGVVVASCHRLLFLQMACEKLCKAYLILNGSPPEDVQSSHSFIAGPMPIILRQQRLIMSPDRRGAGELQALARHLAAEIEMLNPSARRAGRRPDNCEYPWESGARVVSPLDWSFPALQLATQHAGRTILKLIRASIDQILNTTG